MEQFLQAVANHPWTSFWLALFIYFIVDSIGTNLYNIIAVKNQKK